MKLIFAIILALSIVGCHKADDQAAANATGGNVQEGKARIVTYGCASCHTIPGIYGADARVGPPLDHIASRTYIGVGLINSTPNMLAWIKHPRDIDGKAAMPDLHINDKDARDIACYLYTLK